MSVLLPKLLGGLIGHEHRHRTTLKNTRPLSHLLIVPGSILQKRNLTLSMNASLEDLDLVKELRVWF